MQVGRGLSIAVQGACTQAAARAAHGVPPLAAGPKERLTHHFRAIPLLCLSSMLLGRLCSARGWSTLQLAARLLCRGPLALLPWSRPLASPIHCQSPPRRGLRWAAGRSWVAASPFSLPRRPQQCYHVVVCAGGMIASPRALRCITCVAAAARRRRRRQLAHVRTSLLPSLAQAAGPCSHGARRLTHPKRHRAGCPAHYTAASTAAGGGRVSTACPPAPPLAALGSRRCRGGIARCSLS